MSAPPPPVMKGPLAPMSGSGPPKPPGSLPGPAAPPLPPTGIRASPSGPPMPPTAPAMPPTAPKAPSPAPRPVAGAALPPAGPPVPRTVSPASRPNSLPPTAPGPVLPPASPARAPVLPPVAPAKPPAARPGVPSAAMSGASSPATHSPPKSPVTEMKPGHAPAGPPHPPAQPPTAPRPAAAPPSTLDKEKPAAAAEKSKMPPPTTEVSAASPQPSATAGAPTGAKGPAGMPPPGPKSSPALPPSAPPTVPKKESTAAGKAPAGMPPPGQATVGAKPSGAPAGMPPPGPSQVATPASKSGGTPAGMPPPGQPSNGATPAKPSSGPAGMPPPGQKQTAQPSAEPASHEPTRSLPPAAPLPVIPARERPAGLQLGGDAKKKLEAEAAQQLDAEMKKKAEATAAAEAEAAAAEATKTSASPAHPVEANTAAGESAAKAAAEAIDAKNKAEADATRAALEAKRKAEEAETKRKAEEAADAKSKAEEAETKRKAEEAAEAKRKADAEAQKHAEAAALEAKHRAEQAAAAAEAQKVAEAEATAARKAEEAAALEAKAQADALAAKAHAEAMALQREADARKKAEESAVPAVPATQVPISTASHVENPSSDVHAVAAPTASQTAVPDSTNHQGSVQQAEHKLQPVGEATSATAAADAAPTGGSSSHDAKTAHEADLAAAAQKAQAEAEAAGKKKAEDEAAAIEAQKQAARGAEAAQLQQKAAQEAEEKAARQKQAEEAAAQAAAVEKAAQAAEAARQAVLHAEAELAAAEAKKKAEADAAAVAKAKTEAEAAAKQAAEELALAEAKMKAAEDAAAATTVPVAAKSIDAKATAEADALIDAKKAHVEAVSHPETTEADSSKDTKLNQAPAHPDAAQLTVPPKADTKVEPSDAAKKPMDSAAKLKAATDAAAATAKARKDATSRDVMQKVEIASVVDKEPKAVVPLIPPIEIKSEAPAAPATPSKDPQRELSHDAPGTQQQDAHPTGNIPTAAATVEATEIPKPVETSSSTSPVRHTRLSLPPPAATQPAVVETEVALVPSSTAPRPVVLLVKKGHIGAGAEEQDAAAQAVAAAKHTIDYSRFRAGVKQQVVQSASPTSQKFASEKFVTSSVVQLLADINQQDAHERKFLESSDQFVAQQSKLILDRSKTVHRFASPARSPEQSKGQQLLAEVSQRLKVLRSQSKLNTCRHGITMLQQWQAANRDLTSDHYRQLVASVRKDLVVACEDFSLQVNILTKLQDDVKAALQAEATLAETQPAAKETEREGAAAADASPPTQAAQLYAYFRAERPKLSDAHIESARTALPVPSSAPSDASYAVEAIIVMLNKAFTLCRPCSNGNLNEIRTTLDSISKASLAISRANPAQYKLIVNFVEKSRNGCTQLSSLLEKMGSFRVQGISVVEELLSKGSLEEITAQTPLAGKGGLSACVTSLLSSDNAAPGRLSEICSRALSCIQEVQASHADSKWLRSLRDIFQDIQTKLSSQQPSWSSTASEIQEFIALCREIRQSFGAAAQTEAKSAADLLDVFISSLNTALRYAQAATVNAVGLLDSLQGSANSLQNLRVAVAIATSGSVTHIQSIQQVSQKLLRCIEHVKGNQRASDSVVHKDIEDLKRAWESPENVFQQQASTLATSQRATLSIWSECLEYLVMTEPASAQGFALLQQMQSLAAPGAVLSAFAGFVHCVQGINDGSTGMRIDIETLNSALDHKKIREQLVGRATESAEALASPVLKADTLQQVLDLQAEFEQTKKGLQAAVLTTMQEKRELEAKAQGALKSMEDDVSRMRDRLNFLTSELQAERMRTQHFKEREAEQRAHAEATMSRLQADLASYQQQLAVAHNDVEGKKLQALADAESKFSETLAQMKEESKRILLEAETKRLEGELAVARALNEKQAAERDSALSVADLSERLRTAQILHQEALQDIEQANEQLEAARASQAEMERLEHQMAEERFRVIQLERALGLPTSPKAIRSAEGKIFTPPVGPLAIADITANAAAEQAAKQSQDSRSRVDPVAQLGLARSLGDAHLSATTVRYIAAHATKAAAEVAAATPTEGGTPPTRRPFSRVLGSPKTADEVLEIAKSSAEIVARAKRPGFMDAVAGDGIDEGSVELLKAVSNARLNQLGFMATGMDELQALSALRYRELLALADAGDLAAKSLVLMRNTVYSNSRQARGTMAARKTATATAISPPPHAPSSINLGAAPSPRAPNYKSPQTTSPRQPQHVVETATVDAKLQQDLQDTLRSLQIELKTASTGQKAAIQANIRTIDNLLRMQLRDAGGKEEGQSSPPAQSAKADNSSKLRESLEAEIAELEKLASLGSFATAK